LYLFISSTPANGNHVVGANVLSSQPNEPTHTPVSSIAVSAISYVSTTVDAFIPRISENGDGSGLSSLRGDEMMFNTVDDLASTIDEVEHSMRMDQEKCQRNKKIVSKRQQAVEGRCSSPSVIEHRLSKLNKKNVSKRLQTTERRAIEHPLSNTASSVVDETLLKKEAVYSPESMSINDGEIVTLVSDDKNVEQVEDSTVVEVIEIMIKSEDESKTIDEIDSYSTDCVSQVGGRVVHYSVL